MCFKQPSAFGTTSIKVLEAFMSSRLLREDAIEKQLDSVSEIHSCITVETIDQPNRDQKLRVHISKLTVDVVHVGELQWGQDSKELVCSSSTRRYTRCYGEFWQYQGEKTLSTPE